MSRWDILKTHILDLMRKRSFCVKFPVLDQESLTTKGRTSADFSLSNWSFSDASRGIVTYHIYIYTDIYTEDSCGVSEFALEVFCIPHNSAPILQGSLDYLFGGHQTMQMYGKFERFPINSA